jgi:hypothetical protein
VKTALTSLLALVAACSPASPRSDDRRVAAPEVPAEGAGLYYVYEGKVRRADCGEAAPEAAVDIARTCKDLPGNGEPPGVAQFEAALTAAYEQRVGDSAVNDREARAIHQVVLGLPGAPQETALTDAPEGNTANLIEGRVLGLFDAAYDGSDAALAAKPGDDNGLALAATATTIELTRGRLDASRVAVGTATYSLALTASSAVSSISARVVAQSGSTCPLSFSAITRAWIQRNGADVEVPLAADATRPGSYTINGGVAVKPSRAYVRVRRAAGTPVAGSCLLIVEGRTPAVSQPPVDTPRDAKMKSMMAMRSHRIWHFLWHGIRNAWPEMAASERQQVRTRLGVAWARSDAETKAHPQADKGEEFLHMHRGMVQAVRALLGSDMYEAWTAPPAPDSKDYPLPNGNTADSDAEYRNNVLPLHKQAIDPSFLRSKSLGDYGVWLETGLHNALHNRFADARKAGLEAMQGIFQTPQASWDVPNADYLGSTYSAHVNPIFYRLHGYVDARIDDWVRANGYTSIADNCNGAPKCYQWKRLWEGVVPNHTAGMALMEHDEDHFKDLPKSLQRLIQESSTFQ